MRHYLAEEMFWKFMKLKLNDKRITVNQVAH